MACLVCEESAGALLDVTEATARLDSGMDDEFALASGILRVNWRALQKPFDFDRVEIVSADDHDIKGLCLQVGNDLDKRRPRRCRRLPCRVDLRCNFPEATLNMLRATFGKVSVQERARESGLLGEGLLTPPLPGPTGLLESRGFAAL